MNDQIARRGLSHVILVLTGVISWTVEPAMATRLTFVAQGTVDFVDNPLSGTFSLGDNFTVEFTFESLTPDSNPSPNRGDYFNAITALSVTVGPYSATATGDNTITILNNLGGSDQYRIDLSDPMAGPSVNGFDLSTQTPVLQLRDPTSNAFTTDALPTSPPNPADFVSGGTFLALEFVDPTGEPPFNLAFVAANVSSIIIPLHVTLDIKPRSCPNSFNRNSNGVLPVALVGTVSFDVMDVELSSVLLSRADGFGGSVAPDEGPPGPHSEFEDVATPFDGEPCGCQDLGGDSILDLLMHFRGDDVVLALGLDDFPPGAFVEVCVSGMLVDGTPFEACDCIRLVPPRAQPGVMPRALEMPPLFYQGIESQDSGVRVEG